MTIVHDGNHPVNPLYCWRDLRGLVHLAYRSRGPNLTLCNKSVSALRFAGRKDVSTAVPSCLLCVRIQ